MIDGLKSYSDYIDSRLPWLGEIPAHWKVARTKTQFRLSIEKSGTDHGKELLSIYTHIGVRPRKDLEQKGNKASTTDDYWVVRKGDIIVNKLLAWMGAVGVSHFDGVTSPAYDILRPIKNLEPDYYHYLFRTQLYKEQFKIRSRGIMEMRLRLYFDQFGQIPLLCPPPEEQSAIVRFLDYVDRRVRRYIRAKRQLIALLNEQKQAIIHRAVTRGLDPAVKLKPSGIEWLGDVPEGWETTTLGKLSKSFKTGPFGSILHQADYVSGGTPVINPVHMKGGQIASDSDCSVAPETFERLREYVLKDGDVIFSRRGELGRCALVRERETGWLCGTGSIRVRLVPDRVDAEFLMAALQVKRVSEYLSLMSVGATMESLNTGILKGLPLVLPPREEQPVLRRLMESETAKCDRAIEMVESEVASISEYRTRLIADTVTGMVNVQDVMSGISSGANDRETVTDELLDFDELSEVAIDPEEIEA